LQCPSTSEKRRFIQCALSISQEVEEKEPPKKRARQRGQTAAVVGRVSRSGSNAQVKVRVHYTESLSDEGLEEEEFDQSDHHDANHDDISEAEGLKEEEEVEEEEDEAEQSQVVRKSRRKPKPKTYADEEAPVNVAKRGGKKGAKERPRRQRTERTDAATSTDAASGARTSGRKRKRVTYTDFDEAGY
jgi:hypothetical protein